MDVRFNSGLEKVRLNSRLNISDVTYQFDIFVVLLFVLLVQLTPVAQLQLSAVWAGAISLGILFVTRYALTFYARYIARKSPNTFLTLQLVLTLLWSLSWGLFAAYIISQLALGWTTYFLTVATLAISCAYVLLYTTSIALLNISVIATLLPTIASNALHIPGLRGQATWMLMTVFLALLLWMGRTHHRKVIEVLLQRSRLSAIVEAIPGTLCWFDRGLQVLGGNSKFFTTFGGKIGANLEQSDFDPLIHQMATDVFKANQVRVNGTKSFEDKSFYLVSQKYQFGNEALVVGIDISTQESLNRELEIERRRSYQAGKHSELNELLKILVLEEKSNITTIRTLSSMFQDDLTEFWKRVGYLHKAIESVLDPDIFKTTRRIEVRELAELIDATFSTYLSSHEVDITIDGLTSGHIKAHPGAMLLCFSVLFGNAIQAMAKSSDKHLRVIGTVQGTRFQIYVEDTGSGIDEAYGDVIFEPYFSQGPETSSGMGLAILNEIIYSYGGTTGVSHYQEPTRIYIDLPMEEQYLNNDPQ